MVRECETAGNLAISGLLECAPLSNQYLSRLHPNLIARRFPPVHEIRSQMLDIVLDIVRAAPLVGGVPCMWE